jgi:hypothetical protein
MLLHNLNWVGIHLGKDTRNMSVLYDKTELIFVFYVRFYPRIDQLKKSGKNFLDHISKRLPSNLYKYTYLITLNFVLAPLASSTVQLAQQVLQGVRQVCMGLSFLSIFCWLQ